MGYVFQQWHPFSPKFLIANEHNEPVLKIHGPFCGWSCLPDVDFEVTVVQPDAHMLVNCAERNGGAGLLWFSPCASTQNWLLHASAAFIKTEVGIWIWVGGEDLVPDREDGELRRD